MPDEQLGFGPAAIENPEEETPVSQGEAPVEAVSVPEQEAAPEPSGKYEKLLTSVTQATSAVTPNDADEKVDVAHIQTLEDEAAKVEQLVKLAQSKGLSHAVKVAERLKDYYALDMFHDNIVDNLYDTLLEQGLITKE